MENASKALIIAGAILLAIVIISLGLVVVNNTRGTADSANLNEQEIQTFNAKFTPYEGVNISGTRVKTLLQAVRASNTANSDDTKKQITTFTYWSYSSSTATTPTQDTTISSLTGLEGKIESSGIYTITLGYGTDSLVNSIKVIKNK